MRTLLKKAAIITAWTAITTNTHGSESGPFSHPKASYAGPIALLDFYWQYLDGLRLDQKIALSGYSHNLTPIPIRDVFRTVTYTRMMTYGEADISLFLECIKLIQSFPKGVLTRLRAAQLEIDEENATWIDCGNLDDLMVLSKPPARENTDDSSAAIGIIDLELDSKALSSRPSIPPAVKRLIEFAHAKGYGASIIAYIRSMRFLYLHTLNTLNPITGEVEC